MATAAAPGKSLFDLGDDLTTIQAEIVESDGELSPDLEQRLTIAIGAIGDKVDAYGYRIRALQAYAAMHSDRAKFHTLQAQSYSRLEEHLKAALLAVMQRLAIRKLVGTDFTATISESKRTIVDDPAKVPSTDRYWRVKVPELNLESIKRDLADGIEVPGARLEPVAYVRLR